MHFIVVSLEMLNHFQQSTDINIRSLFGKALREKGQTCKVPRAGDWGQLSRGCQNTPCTLVFVEHCFAVTGSELGALTSIPHWDAAQGFGEKQKIVLIMESVHKAGFYEGDLGALKQQAAGIELETGA